jgi:hypothetical protein
MWQYPATSRANVIHGDRQAVTLCGHKLVHSAFLSPGVGMGETSFRMLSSVGSGQYGAREMLLLIWLGFLRLGHCDKQIL